MGLPSEFKVSDLTTVRAGGEASTNAIRQTLSKFCHLLLVLPDLMENASHHARGCEQTKPNEAYVLSPALRSVVGELVHR